MTEFKVGQKIRRKTPPGETATVKAIAADGKTICVEEDRDNYLFITTASWWEPVPPDSPEPGDIWTSGDVDYRVIGVDKKNDVWHFVPVSEWHDGEYPTVEIQLRTVRPKVYTRNLSHDTDPSVSTLTLKHRP